jgi:WD40 repeat protein
MQRYLYQVHSALVLTTIRGITWAAGPVGGYYTEDRTLISPVPGYTLFAVSVAISDGVALVGASRESVTGHAYLYDSKTGNLLHTLSPGNSSVSNFGRTIALEGNYAVVGSDQASYVYDVNTYELLHVLPRSSGIDIDNGRVFIGESGVYDLASGERLSPPLSGGTSVALSGDYAVVGWIGNDGHDPGWARVFDWKSGRFLYNLTPAGMPAGANFGISMAAEGNIVVVGADRENTGGRAYLFDLTTGSPLYQLNATGLFDAYWRSFGIAVAMHNGVAIVGAHAQTVVFPDSPASQFSVIIDYGTAYAFSVQNGQEIARFTAAPHVTGGNTFYSFSLDYDGSQLIAGTMGWPEKAYITDFAIPEPTAIFMLTTCAMIALSRRPPRCTRNNRVTRCRN